MDLETQTKAALSTLAGNSEQIASSTFVIVKYVATAGLAISFLFVLYEVASNNPKAKDYVIAWIIALIIYLMYFEI